MSEKELLKFLKENLSIKRVVSTKVNKDLMDGGSPSHNEKRVQLTIAGKVISEVTL